MKRPEHFVTCGQMKILEQRADEAGLSYYQMMENAGSRAAEFILSKAPLGDFALGSGPSGDELKAAEINHALETAEGETPEKADAILAKTVEISNILANDDDKTDPEKPIAANLIAADISADILTFANSGAMRDVNQHAAGKLAYVFCGKGNNGGDGFVVARLMCNAGWKVTVILVDGEPKTADSIINFGLLAELPIKILDMKTDDRALMKLKDTPDLIVDAIYGTGFKGKLKGNGLKAAIYINKMRNFAKDASSKAVDAVPDGKEGSLTAGRPSTAGILVFALDIPSGLGGDLTRERELDKAAVHAHYTVTFHAKKPVHLKSFAAEYCGEIVIADIGIDEEALMRVEIYDEE